MNWLTKTFGAMARRRLPCAALVASLSFISNLLIAVHNGVPHSRMGD
jgi:hypothetical protein